jgi:CDGSH-type Zn-finger protein
MIAAPAGYAAPYIGTRSGAPMSSDDMPTITPTTDGPYVVEGLVRLSNRHGDLQGHAGMALCRCGGSANKPFCDGTHRKNGFSGAKREGRVVDRRDDYAADGITIHDNRGLCAHVGHCTDGLPAVFRQGQEPWIDPEGAPAEAIVATIRRCPSGALSYSLAGVEHRDREGPPAVVVSLDGPYVVTGGPRLLGAERGVGASAEHYALCRCGGSKNKPFCDGTHWYIGFADARN